MLTSWAASLTVIIIHFGSWYKPGPQKPQSSMWSVVLAKHESSIEICPPFYLPLHSEGYLEQIMCFCCSFSKFKTMQCTHKLFLFFWHRKCDTFQSAWIFS